MFEPTEDNTYNFVWYIVCLYINTSRITGDRVYNIWFQRYRTALGLLHEWYQTGIYHTGIAFSILTIARFWTYYVIHHIFSTDCLQSIWR